MNENKNNYIGDCGRNSEVLMENSDGVENSWTDQLKLLPLVKNAIFFVVEDGVVDTQDDDVGSWLLQILGRSVNVK